MDLVVLFSTIILSYLIGSISFARLISRLVAPHVDITNITMDVANSDEKMKMQAIGANTASMKLGPRVGPGEAQRRSGLGCGTRHQLCGNPLLPETCLSRFR